MLKLHILNSGNSIKKIQEKAIKASFNRALKICKKLIDANNIDIVFYHNPKFVMEETGIGGSTETTNLVRIPVDASRELDEEIIFLTICHELHHAMRQREFGFPKTLLDTVISEGLADQFEKEISAKKPITYLDNVDRRILEEGLEMLIEDGHKLEYDYYGLFFGNEKYPKYFGYTLGNLVVERVGEKPSEMVRKPSEEFIDYIKNR